MELFFNLFQSIFLFIVMAFIYDFIDKKRNTENEERTAEYFDNHPIDVVFVMITIFLLMSIIVTSILIIFDFVSSLLPF